MTEFKLPALGENIEQGDLVRLMITPGTRIDEGQPVMELETDKAVIEVPSSVSGVVQEIRVKEGDKLKVGQVIFTVENGAGGKAKAAEPATAKPVASAAPPAAVESHKAPVEPREAPAVGPERPRTPAIPEKAPTAGASEFRLPELGENVHEGDLVRLMIQPGAKVSEGQPVMELETDKAVVEVPSSVSGVSPAASRRKAVSAKRPQSRSRQF